MVLFGGVDRDEEHLLPERFGDAASGFGDFFERFFAFVQEQQQVGLDFASEYLLGGFVVEFD